jgi:hypothetical protein
VGLHVAADFQDTGRVLRHSPTRSSDFLCHQRLSSAGTDFFIFFLSADLGAVIEYEDLSLRINPVFRQDYLSVFAVLLAASFLLVIVSGLTQRRLEVWREQQQQKASWKYSGKHSGVKYPFLV